MRNAKGQNIVEYILLVTAILIVCIYFFVGKPGQSPMAKSVNASLGSMVTEIKTMNSKIQLQ